MKKIGMATGVAIILLICVSFVSKENWIPKSWLAVTPTALSFTSTVPSDPKGNYNATPEQKAAFAWREFIALNWPAATNSKTGSSGFKRGTASSATLGSTGAGGTVVWETFAHRVELYPGRKTFITPVPSLPKIEDAPVQYQYGHYATIKAAPGADTTLFNNLDEASEITLADMYYTPMVSTGSTKATLLYEAKANNVIHNYVRTNKFQQNLPRAAAATNTIKKINNMPLMATDTTFELPTGSIEMKATWRRYDSSNDKLSDFHWANAIWYSGKVTGTLMANNDTVLLIGLHIIHKTPSFPTFTFATFEHESLEENGFQFVNTHPGVDTKTIPGRAIPEEGVIIASRQYPIPDGTKGSFDLVAYNGRVQKQLRNTFGNSIVWANYKLIGVQGKVANNPGTEVPDQEFFLSNFATETNNSLQFFQGGLSGTFTNIVNPNLAKVFKFNTTTSKYDSYTAGGCIGCHGAQGQAKGYDFSVISANGNSFAPEPPEAYPGGTPKNQNTQGYPIPQKTN